MSSRYSFNVFSSCQKTTLKFAHAKNYLEGRNYLRKKFLRNSFLRITYINNFIQEFFNDIPVRLSLQWRIQGGGHFFRLARELQQPTSDHPFH